MQRASAHLGRGRPGWSGGGVGGARVMLMLVASVTERGQQPVLYWKFFRTWTTSFCALWRCKKWTEQGWSCWPG
eukprot:495136-Prymnesium_polylepis.1